MFAPLSIGLSVRVLDELAHVVSLKFILISIEAKTHDAPVQISTKF